MSHPHDFSKTSIIHSLYPVRSSYQEHEAVVRVPREKIQSGRKKNQRFEGEGGVRVLH